MTIGIAFECFGDKDVYCVLKSDCHLPISGLHSGCQGEVINDLLVRRSATIGLVDEDPGGTHHPKRDVMPVVYTHHDVEHRASGSQHLVIVRPDLEKCFWNAAKNLGIAIEGVSKPDDLHRLLGKEDHPIHEKFQVALRQIYERGRQKGAKTFLHHMESIIRSVIS